MRKLLVIFALLFSFAAAQTALVTPSWGQTVDFNDLVLRDDGLYYNGAPYTGQYTGSYESRENGTITYEGEMINGLREGLVVHRYPSGAKSAEHEYAGGAEVFMRNYYENGSLYGEGSMKDGKKDGHWRYFYGRQEPWQEGPYRNGVRHGEWRGIVGKGHYENGKREGIWVVGSGEDKLLNLYENDAFQEEWACSTPQTFREKFGETKAKSTPLAENHHGQWSYSRP